MKETDVVVIGAGLTGLATAFFLQQQGKKIFLLEEKSRVGGQIHTYHEDGFVFESGPNTGAISHPEVVELFQALSPDCHLTTAHEEAKKRLIWKGKRFHALPSGPVSAITTPLFTLKDKFRILGEPLRKQGTNPDETVAELAARRLGKSFVDYAVDPFLSGVYAGDPHKLVTRYALPKLYNLEKNYGGFIKGTIAKAKEPKSERDRLATKKVFSAEGGLSNLVHALESHIHKDCLFTGAQSVQVRPLSEVGAGKKAWQITFTHADGNSYILKADQVVTTVGSYCLPSILPFVSESDMKQINNLLYAPILQVSVGYKNTPLPDFQVFGGLVPSKEKRDILGILNPSACFDGRAPKGGNLLALFMGGVRHPEMLELSDTQLETMVEKNMREMLGAQTSPDLIRFFRHKRAIPQYEASSGVRFEAVFRVEQQYPGLYIKGNLCGGIGMADRIHQAYLVAQQIAG